MSFSPLPVPEEHLWVEGCRLDARSLPAWRQGRTGLAAELACFLEDWFSDAPTMELQTSGSTGKPRCLPASKAAMRASAGLSCSVFRLKPGGSALLCLPLRYIAGKMMVVRALVAGLHLQLVEPCACPFRSVQGEVDFAPIVPMQALRTLQEDGSSALARAHTLLLGGGFVDASLEEALQGLPSRAFASYGMTETLSHVALRALNGPLRSAAYTPLPGVHVSLSAAGTLCLTVPHLGIEWLETNDLAELYADGSFRILGRRDAVINSGAVKIQAEAVEAPLREATGLALLALPVPHPVLGQCVALLWEGAEHQRAALLHACETLPRYHRPLMMFPVDVLPRTETGKLARAAAAPLLQKLLSPRETQRSTDFL